MNYQCINQAARHELKCKQCMKYDLKTGICSEFRLQRNPDYPICANFEGC